MTERMGLLLRLLRNYGKYLRLIHGKICKNLSIDGNIVRLQAVHQTRVRRTVQTRGRINADNPQGSECALLNPSITVCILQTLLYVMFRDRPNFRPRTPIALRKLEVLLLPVVGRYFIHATWHDTSFQNLDHE